SDASMGRCRKEIRRDVTSRGLYAITEVVPFPVSGLRTIVAFTSTVGMVCNMLPEAIAEQERLGSGALALLRRILWAYAGAWLTAGIPVLYLVFTVPKFEKDGGLARTLGVAIRLLICCLVGLVGRCYIEMGERSAFLRVRKVEEDLTQEKVLRFAAEHENASLALLVRTSSFPARMRHAGHSDVEHAILVATEAAVIAFARTAVAAEEKWLIPWSDVTFQSNLLGKGGYAMVVQGQYAGARVAVKMPSKEQLSTSKEVSDFFGKELRVLRHLRHPFIVNFYGACIEDTKQLVVLIEEYIDGSSLHDMILFQKDKRFTEQVRWQTLSSVGHALMYLHDQGPAILHGDLSAKNIMMRADSLEPVLIDFGMAVLHKSRQKLQGGSPRWMAPELISSLSQGGLAPDCSVDVFAFGRVCFFVATGQLPLQEYTVDELKPGCIRAVHGHRPQGLNPHPHILRLSQTFSSPKG
ncbi:gefX, partial [Symbiodinium sp. CCMP2456]